LALQQAIAIDERGGIATVLCHPICQWLADRFKTFERLLECFAARRTIFAREIIGLMEGKPQ